MPFFDHYARADLVGGTHPQPFSHSSTSHYWLEGEGQCVIDLQRASTVSLQLSGNPEMVQVEVTNQDYRTPGDESPNGYEVVGGSFVVQPGVQWTQIGTPGGPFTKLDTSGTRQLRLTVNATMHVHIALDPVAGTAASWLPAGGQKTLDDVYELLSTQTDFEPLLVQDATTDEYFFVQWQTDPEGVSTLVYFDMDGVPTVAPANPVPVQQRDYEVVHQRYVVVTAGAGYSVGDTLMRISFYDTDTQLLVGEVFRDETTGSSVNPAMTDLEPVPEGAPVSTVVVYDVQAGETVPFVRTYVYDADGLVRATRDTEVDGVTAYSPSGMVSLVPGRLSLGSETVAFNDSGVVSLGSVPAGANHAEYHVWGGMAVVTTTGVAPTDTPGGGVRLDDGASGQFESWAELSGLQVRGVTGASGVVYVEYKHVPGRG